MVLAVTIALSLKIHASLINTHTTAQKLSHKTAANLRVNEAE
jgi:hypothetical protein